MAFPAVEKKAIERALGRLDEEFRDQSEWAGWDSATTHQFAIRVEGKLYPAKKIISLATDIAARDFTNQKSTNGDFRARKCEVIYLHEMPTLNFVKSEIYDQQSEIHGPFGGSFQSGITLSNKTPVVFLFSGESGEQYRYTDEVNGHGVYSYAGERQICDMMLNRGNLAAQQHAATGQALHLFKLGD